MGVEVGVAVEVTVGHGVGVWPGVRVGIGVSVGAEVGVEINTCHVLLMPGRDGVCASPARSSMIPAFSGANFG